MAEQFSNQAPMSGMSQEAQQMLQDFWPKVHNKIQKPKEHDLKNQELPLARIKKIMKLDEDVKMISAEAPVLFAKAAEIFISEISLRAWIHTEDNKRRTLQRNDIAMAISKFDQFDFLIDIVPRDEMKPAKRQEDTNRSGQSLPDQINYYLQLAQQQAQQQQQQQTQTAAATTVQQPAQQTTQVAQPAQQTTTTSVQQPQQQASIQLPGGQIIQQPFQISGQGGQQIIQIQSPQQAVGQIQVQQIAAPQQQQQQQTITQPQITQQQQQASQQQPTQQQTQVYQQVVSPTGEIQNIPIQLTPQQLQAIQLQIQGKQQQATTQQQQQQQPIIVQDQSFTTQVNQPLYQIQGLPLSQAGQQIYIQQPGTDSQQTDTSQES